MNFLRPICIAVNKIESTVICASDLNLNACQQLAVLKIKAKSFAVVFTSSGLMSSSVPPLNFRCSSTLPCSKIYRHEIETVDKAPVPGMQSQPEQCHQLPLQSMHWDA